MSRRVALHAKLYQLRRYFHFLCGRPLYLLDKQVVKQSMVRPPSQSVVGCFVGGLIPLCGLGQALLRESYKNEAVVDQLENKFLRHFYRDTGHGPSCLRGAEQLCGSWLAQASRFLVSGVLGHFH